MFASEAPVELLIENKLSNWKVLIVDDEPLVHQVTKSVLTNVTIDNRKVQFLSAFSGKEALDMMRRHDDIAVIFLDVVMETNDAGLKICRDIREKLNNDIVQIILRTGQPGANPENDIVLKYKINDYKDKTELSAQKLFTCLVSALRSYQELIKIKQNKVGLDKIIIATQQINRATSIPLFMDGVLSQLVTLIDHCERSFVFEAKSHVKKLNVKLMSSFGSEQIENFREFRTVLQQRIITNRKRYKPLDASREYVRYFDYGDQCFYVLYLESGRKITSLDFELLNLLSSNIQVALDKLYAHQHVIQSQQNIIAHLFNGIRQQLSAPKSSMSIIRKIAYQIGHDIRLCSLKLTRLHHLLVFEQDSPSQEPYEVTSDINVLSLSNVLEQLNERYDGSGIPLGLSDDGICIEARILTLACEFEQMICPNKYRSTIDFEDALSLITRQRGKHFDPSLVDCLLSNEAQYREILMGK